MKLAVLFLLLFSTSLLIAAEPQTKCCAGLEFLLGKWEASGSGQIGNSSGVMTFASDLQGQVIIRRNESQSKNGTHNDLMIIYKDSAGLIHGDFFDSEGHVIPYTVTISENPQGAVFLHPGSNSEPGFRFTDTLKADGSLDLLFEIAMPGSTEFKTYVKGTAHRV
jgi:hypothetical protein